MHVAGDITSDSPKQESLTSIIPYTSIHPSVSSSTVPCSPEVPYPSNSQASTSSNSIEHTAGVFPADWAKLAELAKMHRSDLISQA